MARTLLTLVSAVPAVLALNNGLARTPQMGWNTWNHFGCGISQDTIENSAKALISNGLYKLGYEYVLVDNCWQADARDPNTGAPVEDKSKFPDGIKAVADKIHSMGLKFGIYSSAGTYTCGGKFGSLDYEEIDAKTYASWGVDYLKYDNCNNEGRAGTPQVSYERYNNMSKALLATGRPILYSMCNWGEDGPWSFAVNIANSWRISGDIYDNFDRYDDRCPCTSVLDCKLAGFHCAMSRIIDFSAPLLQKSGKGHWNDLDMLEVGNGGMTYDEYVTHFSMWALVKSPLILGNEITSMSDETKQIITNDAIIAVNQDSNGSPAGRVWKKPASQGGDIQLWSGSLSNNQYVFAVLNTSPVNQTVDISFLDVFVDQGRYFGSGTFTLYDLWQKDPSGKWGAPVGNAQGTYSVSVDTHATRVFKVVPAPSSKREL
ncbi:glycoside hydrolase [Dichomitus squalens]|uniref:Alpha-galactosidase n=1 Tax=Dichomitus squalens TaxID=114155 RepID=A0A4Q9N2T7_9APHY|nr:glycoside hydrolase [Dichomitus squalens]